MSEERLPYGAVLVTGASGYIGSQVIAALAADRGDVRTIVAADVRPPQPRSRRDGVVYETVDVRTASFAEIFRRYEIDVVVHLAAIVTPGKRSDRELEYQVDVLGTRNVVEGCVAAGVRKLVYTSSGAAYGYHRDNRPLLCEDDPLRGNPEFAYSHHKRLIEEMLARARADHPELLQLVFRPGTVIGRTTRNQITDLFDGRWILGLSGSSSPFVLIWDADVTAAILRGIRDGGVGIFNVAGDGTLSLREMARLMHKPYVAVPPAVIAAALALLKRLGLTQYGPEQVDFLRYRPVLDNTRLKREFGYVPQKTTREVFELFLEGRRSGV